MFDHSKTRRFGRPYLGKWQRQKLHIFRQKVDVQVLPDHQPVTLTHESHHQKPQGVSSQSKQIRTSGGKKIQDFCGRHKWKIPGIPGII